MADSKVCECGHMDWRHDPDVGCMLETYSVTTQRHTMCDCFTFIEREVIPTRKGVEK